MLTTCASSRAKRSACRERVALAAPFPRLRRALQSLRPYVSRPSPWHDRQPCRVPKPMFPSTLCVRTSSGARGYSSDMAHGRGLWPHSPPIPRGPSTNLPLTTRPPPHPVPNITPNTIRAFPAAPSMASDKAKQFASFASRTGVASATARSRSKARPLSQVELAFCIRPVRGEIDPGTAIPMLAPGAMPCMSLAVRSTMAAIVAA
jgi:hypothetical protein